MEEGYNNYYDNYYDSPSSKYGVKSGVGNIIIYNGGKNILTAVSRPGRVAHYYYNIYDTESGKIINTIKRSEIEALKDCMICYIKASTENPQILFFTTFKTQTGKLVSINSVTNTVNVLNTNDKFLGGSPRYFQCSDSGKTIYVVYYGYVSGVYKNILYSYGCNEAPEMNPYDESKKHKQHFSYSSM